MKNYLRRTWAEVNIDALKHNFDAIRAAADRKARIICVIKADAYGHGAVFLGKLYEKMGADGFAVSNIEEAMQLRENGIHLPVLILGFTPASLAGELAVHHISQAVFSEEYARELSAEAVKQNVQVGIHIKVDTGMSRIGFLYQNIQRDGEAVLQMERACQQPNLVPEGIFTHFARADEENGAEATKKQYALFLSFTDRIEKELGYRVPIRHCSNSAGIVSYPDYNMDMVRAGITMYGLWPSEEVPRNVIRLEPALSLHSHIAYVKEIEAGTPVSYGGTYVADHTTRVATIPVGYGDGYPRSLSGKGYVLICGKRAPIIGRVCMDQFMVNIDGIPEAGEGDPVTLIGTDGAETITAEELGDLSGRFNYELVCDINPRVPRIYR